MKTDFQTIKVTREDNIAILTIDNPPVNQLSSQMMQDFAAAISGDTQGLRDASEIGKAIRVPVQTRRSPEGDGGIPKDLLSGGMRSEA